MYNRHLHELQFHAQTLLCTSNVLYTYLSQRSEDIRSMPCEFFQYGIYEITVHQEKKNILSAINL